MELRLFSSSGTPSGTTAMLEACHELLKGKQGARVACLPQGMLRTDKWQREAERLFRGVAELDVIDTETADKAQVEDVLRRAALVHIPDGNAYLLNHRLHNSRMIDHLRRKVQNGLPVLACGAGTVFCGGSLLACSDLNLVPTSFFDGLGVIPFGIHVRYTDDPGRDAWLSDYHVFHDDPLILMEADGCLRTSGKSTRLSAGTAWLLRPGQPKLRLALDESIAVR